MIALCLAGCVEPKSTGRLDFWAVGSSQYVSSDETIRKQTDLYNHLNRRILLRAARNETVACQLVLRADGTPMERVSVTVGPLSNGKTQLSPKTVRIYRPLFVRAGRVPSWLMTRPEAQRLDKGYPDALVPLDAPQGGQPFHLPSGVTMPLWVDVAIEAGVEAGVYQADVQVVDNGVVIEPLQLQVHVLPFVLPSRPKIPVLTGIHIPTLLRYHMERDGSPYVPPTLAPGEASTQEAQAVIDETLAMLRAHSCSPYLTGFYPTVSLDAAGQLKVAWDDYDRIAGGVLGSTSASDRTRAVAWPMPANLGFPPPGGYGGPQSPAYAHAVQEYLKQCASHFAEKGWLDRAFVWSAPPETAYPELPEAVNAFGSQAHQADPRLRLMSRMVPQSMKPYGWFGHEFDPTAAERVSIWAPPGQFFDPTVMARQRAAGHATWITVDRPPFAPSLWLGAPSVDPIALGYEAFRYSIDGILIPSINDWQGDALSTLNTTNARLLLYPGKQYKIKGPIASVRLKQLRRGLQDLEYLAMLVRHNQGELADTLAKVMFRYGGTAAYEDHFADGCQWAWVDQPELWDLARRLMADRLAQVVGGSASGSFEQFVQTVEWRRLVEAACAIRVVCEGVRVRPTSDAASAGQVDIECHVMIRNERPTPLTGRLKFGKLPVGWKAIADDLAVKSLASLGRSKLVLVARAASIGTNESGIAPVPLEFDGGTSGKIEVTARLAEVSPRTIEKPIVVDGDLNDWPPGIRNTAGDFLLVGGQDPATDGNSASGRARMPTQVFVGQDSQRLYFAFNCREDQLDRLASIGGNVVRYDGLLPADEDLLEILIDPTNSGTGQPIDIYHVVVRPSGAAIVERGVLTGAGWGTSRYWPADVKVAAARQERSWTTEVSIPLGAFDASARSSRRWAINFTRYQPRLGEYSSWSGARRYFYNTRTFGNLQWP